jgi:hypothetical protein
LSNLAITTIKTHWVVHGESGVLPVREGFGELLREESKLQEQVDCAPAQILA